MDPPKVRGQQRTLRMFLDGVRGEQLCGEEMALPAGTTLPLPPEAPTFAPGFAR
jgi:hypothetical protein